MVVLLIGCKTQSVVLPEVHTTDKTKVEVRVDSVWRDRWHTEFLKGDTVFIRDSIKVESYKWLTKRDSVYVRDSIPYEVEVPVVVRQRNWYDKAVSWGFWVLFVLLAIRILILIYTRK